MATIDLLEPLMRGPVGGPHLGAAVACLMLAAVSLGPGGASAVADRADRGSGRAVSDGSRGGAGPGAGERRLVYEANRAARRGPQGSTPDSVGSAPPGRFTSTSHVSHVDQRFDLFRKLR